MWNVRKCGFDGAGDCKEFNEFMQDHPDCLVEDEDQYTYRIGNNICDVKCNVLACSWDKGDCKEFNSQYPGCPVEIVAWLGDGECDGLYNTVLPNVLMMKMIVLNSTQSTKHVMV